MRSRFLILSLLAIMALCLLTAAVYNFPPVHDRLSWRLASVRTQIQHALNPPEQAVFVPQQQQLDATVMEAIVQATLQALVATPTPSLAPTLTPTSPGPTPTLPPSPTPTLPPTPAPEKVVLKGVTHEYQQMNNCGPATLSMNLSFWGWKGDQRDTRAFLRPNFKDIDDKNVMPSEMVNFVETQTQLKALARVGGEIDWLKRLVAAGFPVIVEKGFQPPKEDWMGHYELVNGYDDGRQRFITQDAYIMADFPLPYDEITGTWWRDFNYVFVVVYPPEREPEVFSVLGPQADETYNYQYAAEKARAETQSTAGRDLYFAWFNLGSSLTALEDYPGAAAAYDQAFAVYPTIPDGDRPWRMLWYQHGPYEAYYHTGRFQDVINLANSTFGAFTALDKIGLEETYYWRAMGREALGELDGAISDYEKAVDANPNSTPAREELKRLGIDYP